MFHTVLVANRGEIALRVIRTLRELGIRSVAVYSDPDAEAPHVRAADEAVRIGPASARESYLNAARILEVARATGAEAIHPGYGFLSESADFARRCAEAGVVFIGPSPEALEATGDKAGARETARRLGVPTVPGTEPSEDLDVLTRAARTLTLPVLVKAAAGGGGKGMRRVDAWDELTEALSSAAREARSAFGSGRLLIERYVRPARHVEVQVLGDGRGGVAALGERECSLQRRYQKIIEESPSPAVDERLRASMCDAARRLTAAVRYGGAGTVEFLLGPGGEFYFLEMNARLQVEHPVTEMVRGVDLVRLQLEIAAGESPPLRELEGRASGHAIEARIYAEDPRGGFLPTTGDVLALTWPAGAGVRVDAGIERESRVDASYDPMLAKVSAWGEDRAQARTRLVAALEETVLLGIPTNQEFLLELLESDAFERGETFTHTVEEITGTQEPVAGAVPPLELSVAAALLLRDGQRRAGAWALTAGTGRVRPAVGTSDGSPRGAAAESCEGATVTSPWHSLGRWRLGEARQKDEERAS